jgi:phage baseplate assembly protein W
MTDPEMKALQQAQADYADALAQFALPARQTPLAPADPYGRTLVIDGGDLVVAEGSDGSLDLAMIAGKDELAQGIEVVVGTNLGTDIFNQGFGFDLVNTLAQPRPTSQMRELVRLCVVKALSQEPRIRQILVVAFADEPAYRTIHPNLTDQDLKKSVQQQKTSRKWFLDVQFDTRRNDRIVAQLQGAGA